MGERAETSQPVRSRDCLYLHSCSRLRAGYDHRHLDDSVSGPTGQRVSAGLSDVTALADARADRLDVPALRLADGRAAARREGWRGQIGDFARHDEPHHVARIAYNLSNQFELPVIFYAAVVLLIATNNVTTIDIIAAWVFVAGRVIHTLVQCLTDNVPLRGQVFLINFAGVAVLVGHLALIALRTT